MPFQARNVTSSMVSYTMKSNHDNKMTSDMRRVADGRKEVYRKRRQNDVDNVIS